MVVVSVGLLTAAAEAHTPKGDDMQPRHPARGIGYIEQCPGELQGGGYRIKEGESGAIIVRHDDEGGHRPDQRFSLTWYTHGKEDGNSLGGPLTASEGVDFENLDDSEQHSQRGHVVIYKTVQTLEDGLVEPLESYELGYWEDGNFEHCTVYITDDDPHVLHAAIASTPAAGTTYRIGETIEINLIFSASVTVTDADEFVLPLTVGAYRRDAAYRSGSGTDTLRFEYTVGAGHEDGDGITIPSITSSGLGSGRLKAVDTSLVSYRAADHSYEGQQNIAGHAVDGEFVVEEVSVVTTPRDGSVYWLGETIGIEVEFNVAVAVKQNPKLRLVFQLASGQRPGIYKAVPYVSGSGTDTLRFEYVVRPGDQLADVFFEGWMLNGHASTGADLGNKITYIDSNEEPNYFFAGANTNGAQSIDGRPRATGVEIVSTPGTGGVYGIGETIVVAVTFSDEVNAVDDPQVRLLLEASGDGDGQRDAVFASGSGTTTLRFAYTVRAGDVDSDGLSIAALGEAGLGTIKVRSSVNANVFAHHQHDAQNNLSGHKVDGTLVPRVTKVEIVSTPAHGDTYFRGETILVDVTFSAEVNAMRESRVRLRFDGTEENLLKDATYQSGSGTRTLRFSYRVAIGDLDVNGLTIDPSGQYGLGSGKIVASQATSQAVDHTYQAQNDLDRHKVDAGRLEIVGVEVVSTPWDSEVYRKGEQILANVVFSDRAEEVFWCIENDKCYYHPDLILQLGDFPSITARFAPLSDRRRQSGGRRHQRE